MPIGLSPNCRVWARKDAVVGGSEWVLATVAGNAGMANGKDTVQVLLPGTKRRKTMSSADVVPTTVQVVLKPLENGSVGTVYKEDFLTKVGVGRVLENSCTLVRSRKKMEQI